MSITKSSTKKALKAGQLVDGKHVDSLLSAYKKERWVHTSKRLGRADSLSVWYGMSELLEFIQVARENGADGIRTYFGVYPENFEKKPQYRGYQTIVMVATKTKRNEDGSLVTKHVYYQTEKGTELLAFNVNTPCPPDCYPDDTGDGVPFGYSNLQDITLPRDHEGDVVVS
jgi:hypothetical protein